jgi:hypothetical protein
VGWVEVNESTNGEPGERPDSEEAKPEPELVLPESDDGDRAAESGGGRWPGPEPGDRRGWERVGDAEGVVGYGVEDYEDTNGESAPPF